MNKPVRKVRYKRIKREDGGRWSDREVLDFVGALQQFGFKETAKISEAVRTKSESAVKVFIASQMKKASNEISKGTQKRGRKRHLNTTNKFEEMREWPTIRKWQKIAQNQMMYCVRRNDYSRVVIQNICDKFYCEAEEPTDSQVVNVKFIYKYVLDCMCGRVPLELPPIESAVVLMLLRFMKEMKHSMEMDEEHKFIKTFKKATTFIPFQVKDEFRKKARKVPEEDTPGTVPIPEEVYCNLSRHRKVVQSFNPLMVPMWLLVKEQSLLAHLFST